jgi:enoyl-CoA hydratase/carnithine racemase
MMNVVINNTFSSINLFDAHVQSDVANLIDELQANDTAVRVVVFESGNPDFFFGHININYKTRRRFAPATRMRKEV